MTAKTKYHEVSFRVRVKTTAELESPRGVSAGQTHLTRLNQLLGEAAGSVSEGCTLLAGDTMFRMAEEAGLSYTAP